MIKAVRSSFLIRTVFICAVAFLAATLGDALVESISNAQVLWHGNYTDRSSLNLLPMSAVALATFMATLTLVLTEHLRRTCGSLHELWSSTARVLVPSDIPSLLPAIFALQIPTLFVMETVEQIVVYGHPLGGTLWLGGPILAALFLHAFIAATCAFLVAYGLTVLAQTLLRAVTLVLSWFIERLQTRRIFVARMQPIRRAAQTFCFAHTGERGPPLFSLR
jgi:hypothetical protein